MLVAGLLFCPFLFPLDHPLGSNRTDLFSESVIRPKIALPEALGTRFLLWPLPEAFPLSDGVAFTNPLQ